VQALGLAGALALSRGVAAQSEAGAPAAPEPAPPAGAAAAAAEPAAQVAPAQTDAAAELYDLAFEALALDRRDLALQLLQQLQTEHPGHRLAGRAGELRAALASTPPSAPPQEPAAPALEPPASPNQKTGAARAELLFFQTLHGIALGAETCVMLDATTRGRGRSR